MCEPQNAGQNQGERSKAENTAQWQDVEETVPQSSDDMLQWVMKLCNDILNRRLMASEQHLSFQALGLDSRLALKLSTLLSEALGLEISPIILFTYPTPARLAAHLMALKTKTSPDSHQSSSQETIPMAKEIAIIGMGCDFPGGLKGLNAFWAGLMKGIDAIQEVPADRWDLEDFYDANPHAPGRSVSKWGGFIDGMDEFDPLFFGISPREAREMDPQQRLLLRIAWETLEDAGLLPKALKGERVGVYIGAVFSDYLKRSTRRGLTGIQQHTCTGNALSILANRISYTFGFQGPSLTVDTACSSSLVALDLAIQSLRSGSSTMALVGGVNLMTAPDTTVMVSKFGGLSPTGRCYTFDKRADGYVRGEGAGLVLLKERYAAERDGNRIYAIIKGTAVNNDGHSNGLTAPNPQAQIDLLKEAYQRAYISPASVDYVELHGTGTALGDPIEAQALGTVLGKHPDRQKPLSVGSVKSNIGHLEAAAGIAGLIKAALCLHHQSIPPSIHFETVNPHINLQALGLKVCTSPLTFTQEHRLKRIGVSGYGFGGTNAHCVLEGHAPGPLRLPGLAKDKLHSEAVAHPNMVSSLVFLFPGLGCQWNGMGAELYKISPTFRAEIQSLDPLFRTLTGYALHAWLLKPDLSLQLEATDHHHLHNVVIVAIEICLAAHLRSWGLFPTCVVGQSIGEISAAAISGAISHEEAIRLAFSFGKRYRKSVEMGNHAMAMVGRQCLPLSQYCDDGRETPQIIGQNDPTSLLICGERDVVERLISRARSQDQFAKPFGFVTSHCPMTAPYFSDLKNEFPEFQPRVQTTPIYSTVLGRFMDGRELDLSYWQKNATQGVRFSEAIETLLKRGYRHFMEISPHSILERSLHLIAKKEGITLQSYALLNRHKSAIESINQCLNNLHMAGHLSTHKSISPMPLMLSARHAKALRRQVTNLAEYIEVNHTIPLADMAKTLGMARTHFTHRAALTVSTHQDAIHGLRALSKSQGFVQEIPSQRPKKMVFLFSGQGTQYTGMGEALYEQEWAFRQAFDRCAAHLDPHLAMPLRSLVFDDAYTTDLAQTRYSQVAIFALEWALAALWKARGIVPDIVLGHSLGEITAATYAGVLDLADACRLVNSRAEFMQKAPRGGAMCALSADEDEVKGAILGYEKRVSIAAINGPRQVVLSGHDYDLKTITTAFDGRCQWLEVSHAFHSPMMGPVLGEFRAAIQDIAFKKAQIELLSSAEPDTERVDFQNPEYWVQQIRKPVRFHALIQRLHQSGPLIGLEVGPSGALCALAQSAWQGDSPPTLIPSLRRQKNAQVTIADATTQLFLGGWPMDFSAYFRQVDANLISMPGYAFEKQRLWMEEHSKTEVKQGDIPLVGGPIAGGGYIYSTGFETEPASAPPSKRLGQELPTSALLKWVSTALKRASQGHARLSQATLKRLLPEPEAGHSALQIQISPPTQGPSRLPVGSLQVWNRMHQSPWRLCLSGKFEANARTEANTSAPVLDRGLEGYERAQRRLNATQYLYEITWQRIEHSDKKGGALAQSAHLSPRLAQWLEGRALHMDIDDNIRLHLPDRPGDFPLIHPMAQSQDNDFDWVAKALNTLQNNLISAEISDGLDIWITHRAQHVVDSDAQYLHSPGAALWAMARSFRAENPDRRLICLDVDDLSPNILSEALQEAKLQSESEISWRRKQAYHRRLTRADLGDLSATWAESPILNSPLPMVITGASGALGQAVGKWLVGMGKRKLILLSRRGAPRPWLEALQEDGVQVWDYRVDISDRTAFSKVAADLPEVGGIFHCAGLLEDGALATQTPSSLRRVWAPKIDGAQNLRTYLKLSHLKAFILFSSAAGSLKSGGQSNYAAANAYLDALAIKWRKQGLPAQSLAWGPWGEVGMAARLTPQQQRRLNAQGYAPLPVESALGCLEISLQSTQAHLLPIALHWPSLVSSAHPPPIMQALLKNIITRVGHTDDSGPESGPEILSNQRAKPKVGEEQTAFIRRILTQNIQDIADIEAEALDFSRPLMALGLDSLMIIDLRNRLLKQLGICPTYATLLESPDLNGLVRAIEADLKPSEDKTPASPGSNSLPFEVKGLAPPTAELMQWRPASSAQRRMAFLQETQPPSHLYHLHTTLEINGKLDPNLLEESLHVLWAHHEELQVAFRIDKHGQLERAALSPPPRLKRISWRELGGSSPAEAALSLAQSQGKTRFNLSQGSLMRATLIEGSENQSFLAITCHHIIVDGLAFAQVLRDWSMAYDTLELGNPPQLPATGNYEAERLEAETWLKSLAAKEAEIWWQTNLKGYTPTPLPPLYRSDPQQKHTGTTQLFTLDAAESRALEALAERHSSTVYMVVLALWALILERYTGRSDVLIACPVAGRPPQKNHQTVGLYVNTLPLRCQWHGDVDFETLIRGLKTQCFEAFEHQALGLDRILRVTDIPHGPNPTGENPLQFCLVMVDGAWVIDTFANRKLKAIDKSITYDIPGTSKFDLTLALRREGSRYQGSFEFSHRFFDASMIEDMIHHLKSLVFCFSKGFSQSLNTVPLSPSKPSASITGFKAQHQPLPSGENLAHQHILDALWLEVQAHPHHLALITDEISLSYSELWKYAQHVAQSFIEEGLKKGGRVVITLPRRAETVVAIVATLMAGGIYVPVDSRAPQARVKIIIEDTQPDLILKRLDDLPHLKSGVSQWVNDPNKRPSKDFCKEHETAYILYTSGSTGQPKGVMISHLSLANFLFHLKDRNRLKPQDVILAHSSFAFDTSLLEVLGGLTHGATLVLSSESDNQEPERLIDLMIRHKVSYLELVPSLLKALLHFPNFSAVKSLRSVVCGGEALTPHLAQSFQKRSEATLWNSYGPTEATIEVSAGPIPSLLDVDLNANGSPLHLNLGAPNAGVQFFILDAFQRPVPLGVVGELYIGGASLAQRYWNRPKRTKDVFITKTWSDGQRRRLYRSGDRVRLFQNGRLEFMGRKDQQVKLRGQRIELEGITHHLETIPDIAEAITLIQGDGNTDARLVAYYATTTKQPIEHATLKAHLTQVLPSHMLPQAFICLPTLPKLVSGKVNKKALPKDDALAPISRHAKSHRTPPMGPLETQIASLFAQLLGLPSVDALDDFFQLGGHSLLAMTCIARLKTLLADHLAHHHLKQLTVGQLLATPSPRKLAAALLRLKPNTSDNTAKFIWLKEYNAPKTLVLIHPVGGDITAYLPLANALHQQLGTALSIAAIEAPKTTPSGIKTLSELAKYYLERLKAEGLHSNFILGGWSFGGLLAQEMAHQMAETDASALGLLLIDAWSGLEAKPRKHDLDLLYSLMTLAEGFWSAPGMPELDWEVLQLEVKNRAPMAAAEVIYNSASRKGFPITLTRGAIHQLFHRIYFHQQLIVNHTSKHPSNNLPTIDILGIDSQRAHTPLIRRGRKNAANYYSYAVEASHHSIIEKASPLILSSLAELIATIDHNANRNRL